MDFFDTAGGQIIAGAHRYLSAARLLRNSDEFDSRPSLLMTPTLHLVAHGIELLLKFPLLQSGLTVEDVRKRYGHDLDSLWAEPLNARLRDLVIGAAKDAWTLAEQSGDWPDDFRGSPGTELVDQLQVLAQLHGRATDFALRYVAPPNTLAPRPAFLVDAFGATAERVLKNPALA